MCRHQPFRGSNPGVADALISVYAETNLSSPVICVESERCDVTARAHVPHVRAEAFLDPGATIPASTGSVSISDPPNGSSDTGHTRSERSGSQSPLPASISGVAPSTSAIFTTNAEENVNTASVPLDGGYMKYNNIGTANYVGSSHWAAVLDSISELKENVEQQEEIRNMATDFNPHNPVHSSSPRLLYGCQQATKAEIISSIPPRRAADRLVSRYLTLDIPSGIFHRGHFLVEYDNFWKDPSGTSVMWICLLFTIMCLGELDQHSQTPTGNTPQVPTLDNSPTSSIYLFRERIVQCLVDPKHFSEIPAFAGEMRRRVWATIFQIDIGFSALAGLPRMIKPQQCDTEEPRNLLDSDFDENTLELPQSRPESEVTPVLFLLAKNRIISVGGLISDLAHDIRPYPYTELMRFEKLLRDTRNSLPASLRWQPLSQSITESPQTLMQRYSGDYKDIIDEETFQRIQSLLRKSHDIWMRSSSVSDEAQKAVRSLGIILGIQLPREDGEFANQLFGGSEDFFAQFNNPASWPAYQGEKPVSTYSRLFRRENIC
ncbi:hypothetical protein V502_03260 [Pseudogymnoascus sp. VKM F-4520 (FW-2644)]|nr:hypothetical protein V502_03260 [Pseudogymnoascus sp. VKM F-4520 (FW-2644)]